MTDNQVIEQLNRIYYEEETWIENKVSMEEIGKYHKIALERGNIFYAVKDENIVGYCETWRIDFDQLGKIVCNVKMDIDTEDTVSGNIAFVCNVWIHRDFRKKNVIKLMRDKWYMDNSHCDYYCGHAQRKKVGLYKCFTKDKLVSNLFKGEK